MKKVIKIILPILMLLNGLIFILSISVLGNREAALQMHTDVIPTASTLMLNMKLWIVIIIGILYIISAIAIFMKKYHLAIVGVIAFIVFEVSYIIELIMWAQVNPSMWINFGIFGSLSLIIGIYSWLSWKKRV